MFKYILKNKEIIVENLRANLEFGRKVNKSRFFIGMAEYIGSKTVNQCKSRYQKKEISMLEAIKVPVDILGRYKKLKNKKSGCQYTKLNDIDIDELNTVKSHSKSEKSSQLLITEENSPETNSQKSPEKPVKNDESHITDTIAIDDQIDRFLTTLPKDDLDDCENRSIDIEFCNIAPAQLNISFMGYRDWNLMSREGSSTRF